MKFCADCGKELKPGSGVCVSCGTEAGFRMTTIKLTGVVLVSLAVGAIGHSAMAPKGQIAPGYSGPASRSSNPPMVAPGVTPAMSSLADQVRQVASQFMCGCGNCGDDTLWDCDCEHPRGATETKNLIASRLQSGQSVQQIVADLKVSYGHYRGM